MAKHNFILFTVDEIQYFLDYIVNNIADYDLKELTNGYMGDIPNIVSAHPLAMEYGAMLSATDQENYTSILPAIGIELLDDTEHERQPMGHMHKTEEITQAWITATAAIAMKDRFKDGILMSDTIKDAIQAAKTAKGSEKLWATTNQYLQQQAINISAWTDHPEVTRMLYVVLRAILKRAKIDLAQNGVKNLIVRGQTALYNYEFGGTLFGAEFNLSFINSHKDLEVDTTLATIKTVEHHMESGKAGPTFVQVGS